MTEYQSVIRSPARTGRAATSIGWAAVILLALWHQSSGIPEAVQWGGLALGLLLLGLPHGAMDPLLWWLPRRWGVFLGAYVLTAFAFWRFWEAWPLGGFGVFWVLSWGHFAMTPAPGQRDGGWVRTALAGWILHAPFLVAPDVMQGYVQTLAGLTLPPALLRLAAGIALACGGALLLLHRREGLHGAVWLLTTAGLPPLLSFAVYFCGYHARGHLDWVRGFRVAATPSGRRLARLMVGVTVAGFCIGSGILVANGLPPVLVFQGIGALTLPHALLVGWRRWMPTPCKQATA